MKTFAVVASLLLGATNLLASETITFDGTWKEQGFLRFFSNDFLQQGHRLDVISDETVSLLWKPLSSSHHSVDAASWNWRVKESVDPTNLTEKGGDDRNLAIYFVFVDEDRASRLTTRNAMDVSRFDAAPLIAFIAAKETNYGIETNG